MLKKQCECSFFGVAVGDQISGKGSQQVRGDC